MKHIKHINEEFYKINEELLFPLLKNESLLKDKLIKSRNFALGEVSEALTDIAFSKWQLDNKMSYEDILNWTKNEYGVIPYFTLMFTIYNSQVCNGGHSQYYYNGYASSNSSGFGSKYENIDIHEDFINTFYDLNLKKILPYGNKMYDVINSFTLELEPETEDCANCNGGGKVDCDICNNSGKIECPNCNGTGEYDGETCSDCYGDGVIDCDECYGEGEQKCDECDGSGIVDTGDMIPDEYTWSTLDDQWYNINESVVEQYNDYLKSLTLDGENIEDLIEIAKSSQKYNI